MLQGTNLLIFYYKGEIDLFQSNNKNEIMMGKKKKEEEVKIILLKNKKKLRNMCKNWEHLWNRESKAAF